MTTFAGQLTTVITRDQADLGLTHIRYLTPQNTKLGYERGSPHTLLRYDFFFVIYGTDF